MNFMFFSQVNVNDVTRFIEIKKKHLPDERRKLREMMQDL